MQCRLAGRVLGLETWLSSAGAYVVDCDRALLEGGECDGHSEKLAAALETQQIDRTGHVSNGSSENDAVRRESRKHPAPAYLIGARSSVALLLTPRPCPTTPCRPSTRPQSSTSTSVRSIPALVTAREAHILSSSLRTHPPPQEPLVLHALLQARTGRSRPLRLQRSQKAREHSGKRPRRLIVRPSPTDVSQRHRDNVARVSQPDVAPCVDLNSWGLQTGGSGWDPIPAATGGWDAPKSAWDAPAAAGPSKQHQTKQRKSATPFADLRIREDRTILNVRDAGMQKYKIRLWLKACVLAAGGSWIDTADDVEPAAPDIWWDVDQRNDNNWARTPTNPSINLPGHSDVASDQQMIAASGA